MITRIPRWYGATAGAPSTERPASNIEAKICPRSTLINANANMRSVISPAQFIRGVAAKVFGVGLFSSRIDALLNYTALRLELGRYGT
jgi:hypothetical protein